jgi:hypothetical protein
MLVGRFSSSTINTDSATAMTAKKIAVGNVQAIQVIGCFSQRTLK